MRGARVGADEVKVTLPGWPRDLLERLAIIARDPLCDLAGKPKRLPGKYRTAILQAIEALRRQRWEDEEAAEERDKVREAYDKLVELFGPDW